MIKKLSFKFVLVFLVLVVSVFITSSCYASEKYNYSDFEITIDKEAKTLTVVNTIYNKTITYDISYGLDNYSNYYFQVNDYPDDDNDTNFGLVFSNNFIWKSYTYNNITTYTYGSSSSYAYYFNFMDLGPNYASSSRFSLPWGSTCGFAETSSNYYMRGEYSLQLDSNYNYKYGNVEILTASHTITAPNGTILFEPKADTSFEYSFNGIKRGQVELKIDSLDSSLNMYGYVGVENTYEIGDTFVSSTLSKYLRLIGMNSDNSDLSCSLYEREKLLYYIVDEDNVILDIGYISELAEGYFLYGFKVNDGVDFVFLKNGQVFWDNNLTFKYKNGNSNSIQNNDIVSMGEYSYIETNKAVATGVYTGYVYDLNGTLLSEAKCNYSNDLSSLFIKVDTSYSEVKTLLKHYSCYWLETIYLTGNNIDGSTIDFSDYYINWSVPSWVNFDKIELSGAEYNKYSGTLTGFSSEGVLSMFNLKLYEYLSEHTKSFDITFQVYDNNGTLVLTYVVNSDDIVENQISSEENNVDKGDYGILDNPNYTGGSNSGNIGNINNIQDWTADDYINLMSTDNFVWEFFKAILGNLPWWITTPLTILIFGVVIITLIRFARGA